MNDIKEAVKAFYKKAEHNNVLDWAFPLYELAERYLEVEAVMPDKKESAYTIGEIVEDSELGIIKTRNSGYNKAIDDCTLAVTKMLAEKDAEITELRKYQTEANKTHLGVIAENEQLKQKITERLEYETMRDDVIIGLKQEIERLKQEEK